MGGRNDIIFYVELAFLLNAIQQISLGHNVPFWAYICGRLAVDQIGKCRRSVCQPDGHIRQLGRGRSAIASSMYRNALNLLS